MKKKTKLAIFIPLGIIMFIILLLIVVGSVLMRYKTFSVARIIKTETNTYLWVTENQGPTAITQKGLCDFDGIGTGDKVLLICDSEVLESYPGQNAVYFCKKLEDGTRDDLPEVHVKALEEMGWKISYDQSSKTIESIVDKTKNSDIATAEALEMFYSDENYYYFFSSIKSEYIIVTFKDGTKAKVSDAIANGQITISDLDSFGIDYIKETKRDPSGEQKVGGESFFEGQVLEINENTILVKPNDNEEIITADKISVSLDFISTIPVPTFKVGDRVRVIYNGQITKSIPPQINGVFVVYLLGEDGNVLSPTPKNN